MWASTNLASLLQNLQIPSWATYHILSRSSHSALNQPALLHRRRDEAREQRVRLEGAALLLGVVLHADEPGVAGQLDDLGQQAVGRHAAEAHACRLQPLAVARVHLVAMTVALGDQRAAVDLRDLAALGQLSRIGPEPHGAAEVAVELALLQLVAAHPLGHEADDGLLARPELGGAGLGDADEIARRLDHRHLHAEADAEVGHLARAREAGRQDLALRAALAEAAGDENAVHVLQIRRRVLALEHLALDPGELDLHLV